MTPINLQDDLVDELKHLFEPFAYKAPLDIEDFEDETEDSEKEAAEQPRYKRVPLNVYAQALPVQESDEDADPVPYLIVRLSSGSDSGGESSFNTVKLVIIIGIWDDDLSNQGHRDVLNIIQKIYERFSKNPCLNHRSVYTGEWNWALQEDGYFPYYFGACSMSFNIAAIRREDPLA